MKKDSRSLRRLAGAIIVVAASAFATTATAQTGVDLTIEYGDRRREYRLFVPPDLDRTRPTPVVFVLHGGGGSGVREEGRTRYNHFAERDGWIVVYPNGVDGHWNDLRGFDGFVSHREDVDDVGLISELLDRLIREFAVDEARVFVTGSSNGGLLSHTVAARLADRIAAIAPIVGSMPTPIYEEFRPSRPVSVLLVNDRGDRSNRWEGGAGGRANYVSVPKTIARWKQANGCVSETTVSADAIADEPDDTRVRHTVWSGCSGGSNMELYVAEANRHGPPRAILDKENGRRVYEVVWDFFARSGR